MIETGRQWIGPASDLVEVEDEDGLKHTAIVFHEEWRQHPAITDALGVVLGFLESPMVTGLVELVHQDTTKGMFVYPTGMVWSVAEVVRLLSDRGERGGIRAGLELMYTAGQILVEGADAGQAQGVYSHGGLTPRRIMVKADGQVMIIGHGLPQVEILQFHATPAKLPREDSFRYCPPERIEARPEDCSSDLFGLCLIAFELMTGKPVYDGLVNDIRQQAARGEGSRRLFRFREVLPEPVRNVLTKVLRPEPEARYVLGEDFLQDVHSLLSDRAVPGPSLMDLMAQLQNDQRRMGEQVAASSTQMVDGAELREQLGALGRSSQDVWRPNTKRSTPAKNPDAAPEQSLPEPDQSAPPAQPEVGSAFDAPPSTEQGPRDARWSKVRRPVRRSVERPVEQPPLPEPVDTAPPMAAGPETRSTDAPLPPQVPPPGRRTPRRQSQPAEPLPPVLPPVGGTQPTADDLLLQIRGVSSSPPAPDVPHAAPRGSAIEVMLSGEDDDDCATVMMTPDQLRAKLAEEMEAPAVPTPPAGSAVAGTSGTLSVRLLDQDGSTLALSVPQGATVGGVISAAVGVHLVLPTDQTGAIQGWYRLRKDERIIDSREPAEVLSDGRAQVCRVDATTREVEVIVRGKGKDVRFSNPMNTAVPVRSLVRHLVDWLAVGSGDWCLQHAGAVLDGDQILADIEGQGPLTLEFSTRTR
jgi:serine/threonine protein kinase